jgi:hypothetical protein
MRYRNATCALYAVLVAMPAAGQTPAAPAADTLVPPPAWAYNDLACAPSILTEKRSVLDALPLRVVGTQHDSIRDLIGPPDILVISGGSGAGLETGQRYYVRRVSKLNADDDLPATIHTAGWIQILGVDTAVATATILHACDGILLDDYLEPFTEPRISAQPLAGTVPQYENMGKIVTGIEGLHTAAAGNLMTIDRGINAGVVVGQRFLVFRDKRDQMVETTGRTRTFAGLAQRSPLVEIGEALVVSARPNDATVQITVAKTAVTTGDLIAPIR